MSIATVHFSSKDGLTVTADYYAVAKPRGFILLCHRSHFNRGEYHEIAPRLNELGFSCLAIDQRSGMKVLGTLNETYALAKQKGLPTGYLAARPDIEAAIDYVFVKNGAKPIIVVGSSYSASLALVIAAQDSSKIQAVVAFSPGEYLKGLSVSSAVEHLLVPTFVTSAQNETASVAELISSASHEVITHYRPQADGAHGARALWQITPGSAGYWHALEQFLTRISKEVIK